MKNVVLKLARPTVESDLKTPSVHLYHYERKFSVGPYLLKDASWSQCFQRWFEAPLGICLAASALGEAILIDLANLPLCISPFALMCRLTIRKLITFSAANT